MVQGLAPNDGVSLATFVMRADGRFVYAAYRSFNERSGLLVFARDEAGALSVVQQVGDGFDDWVELSIGLGGLALSPDGRFLYAARDSDPGGVIVLDLEPSTGLAQHARMFPADRFARALALSPDGGLLYRNGAALDVWVRDAATGAVEPIQQIALGEQGAGGAEKIVTSADGRFIVTWDATNHGATEFQRVCGDGIVRAAETGGEAEQCDDGNVASGDGCDAACRVEPCFTCAGEPSACAPAAGPCDDGDPCTIDDTCTGGVCSGAPAPDGATCDDENGCTTGDTCRSGACIGAGRVACSVCGVCDREAAACVGMFDRGCHLPPARAGGSAHEPTIPPIGSFVPTRTRSLRAVFTDRDPASAAGIGNPTTGTSFTVCLLDPNEAYDRQRRRMIAEATVPTAADCSHRSCWRRTPKHGFAFHDRRGEADGVRRLVFGRTKSGGLRLSAVAGGGPFDLSAVEPVATEMTMQIFSDTGACWQGNLTGTSR
jgi:cysteine-rich repeat protein